MNNNKNKDKRMISFNERLILRMFSDARKSYNSLKEKQANLVLLRFKSSEDTTLITNYNEKEAA